MKKKFKIWGIHRYLNQGKVCSSIWDYRGAIIQADSYAQAKRLCKYFNDHNVWSQGDLDKPYNDFLKEEKKAKAAIKRKFRRKQ